MKNYGKTLASQIEKGGSLFTHNSRTPMEGREMNETPFCNCFVNSTKYDDSSRTENVVLHYQKMETPISILQQMQCSLCFR